MKDIEIGTGLIRVQIKDYQNKKYLDIRKFYKAENDEWKPTKKGITLSLDIAEEVLDIAKKELNT